MTHDNREAARIRTSADAIGRTGTVRIAHAIQVVVAGEALVGDLRVQGLDGRALRQGTPALRGGEPGAQRP